MLPVSLSKINWGLVLSVSLNILFLSGGVILLPKKGVTSYLLSNQVITSTPSPVKFSAYYLDRKSLFEVLPHSQNEIIFLGDSITNKCEWSELLDNPNIKNRGISGDNLYGVLNRLPQVTNLHPKKIFVMIGINDIIANEKLERIIYKYRLMLLNIKQSTPETKVYIQSVLPVNNNFKWLVNNNDVITLNQELKLLADKFKYEYVDLYSALSTDNQLGERYTNDGLHLNGDGYLVWKQAISKYMDYVDGQK